MSFDLHTHHRRCGHAIGEIEDYIQAAIDFGLQAIGISDHSPYFAKEEDHPDPGLAMAKSEFAIYVEEMLQLKNKYEGRIEVLIGVESDFFPNSIRLYEKMYQKYPMDYIIGSVHISNGMHVSANQQLWYDLSEEQLELEKVEYFSLLQQAAKSGVFQIIGHMDLIRRYYRHFMLSCRSLIEQTMQVFAETGVTIEVNTSGIMRNESTNPNAEILEIAYHYGIPLTFGSDAHKPTRVGEHWDDVVNTLRQLGYREMWMFRQRKPIKISI